jgi:hypothetical protein
MYNSNFEFISNLQYQIKSLTARVKAFESGEKYIAIRAEYKSQLSVKDREIRKLKQELAEANCRTVTMRNNWMQVFDDLEKAYSKVARKKDHEIESLKKRLLETEIVLETTREKLRDKSKELYASLTELEEEKGRNQKLKAQMNRDYENSSIPSSMKPNHRKIANNREKTDRKPGGQPGHKGHGRKRLIPTHTIPIPAPTKYAENPEYRRTGKTIAKQMINAHIDIVVDEYVTPEFRNIRTGQRVHASFPDGMVNEVNYGGSIKALAFLLNSRYCMSIDKVRELLSELTGGVLRLSNGMISGLCKVFSGKTKAEQKSIFSDLLLSPVMNVDFTSSRLNGKNVQVLVCATTEKVMYFAKEHKGHEGVKGTPVEDYQGILIHDHDKTFYRYGGSHQECLSHPLRYLLDSMGNEPALTWNKQMRGLLQEMIHYRNSIGAGDDLDPEKAKAFEARYQEILTVACNEYEYEPPNKYYMDGYNLYKRLDEYKDCHLLILYDRRVPTSNNLSERLLRILKRRQKQALTFRCFESFGTLCDSLGLIESFRLQGRNLYDSAIAIFDRCENPIT